MHEKQTGCAKKLEQTVQQSWLDVWYLICLIFSLSLQKIEIIINGLWW